MKILFLTSYFPPEIGSASHLFYELGESLVKNGHQVTVVTCIPRYNIKKLEKKYRKKIFIREEIAGMKVNRVRIPSLPRKIPILRGLDHFLIAKILGLTAFFQAKHDLVIIYSPPITLGLTAYNLKLLKGMPFLVNVQDLFPQSAIDLGILKNKFLIKFFRFIENFIYRKADALTCHSEGNKKYLCDHGAKQEKIFVVPNWVDTDLIKPVDKDNEFSQKYNLKNKFVVSFAGILGYSQDLKIIIETAELLQEEKEITFLLIGEGVEKEKYQKIVQEKKIDNLLFIPMQPKEKYPLILAASDIGLVTLKKEVVTPVVPSKILSIMAAGRPIVAALNLEGDAPRLIKKANSGIVLEAGDSRGLAEAILKLYKNRNLTEEMGVNGRKYAEENFSRRKCVKIYQDIFYKLIK